MGDYDLNENTDSAWQLLSQSSFVSVDKGFHGAVVTKALETEQDSAPSSAGVVALLTTAPAAWRIAAAAVVILSASMASLGVFTGQKPPQLVAELDKDVSIVVGDWSRHDPSDSQLTPFEDALATEALDDMLGIEDSESLDDEDLLFLLFPDWELL